MNRKKITQNIFRLSKRTIVYLCWLVVAGISAQVQTIDLKGRWRFAMDDKDQGMAAKWYVSRLGDAITLPGSMVENGKGYDLSLTTRFTGSIYDSSWYYNPRMAKYRQLDNLKMPFWLTQQKHYQGYAWYQTDVEIPADWQSGPVELYLEHPHFISRVWLDEAEIGTDNSLTTAHVFRLGDKLSAGHHTLTIRIDNRMKDFDVGANSHSVTDHTQGNWNGIVGKIELRKYPRVFISSLQVFPDIKNHLARVKLSLEALKREKVQLQIKACSFNSAVVHQTQAVDSGVQVNAGLTTIEMVLPMGEKMQLWDEFDPALYKLEANLSVSGQTMTRYTDFGMREITIQGKWFYVNGRKTMMRGTVENALFPLTGYPPMDVSSWERVFRICKSYGLNHMRFHSYCPPEAAFIAADKAGFYLQPEGPSWPNHSTQLGRGLPIDRYLMDETIRMTKDYGNHPSFTMMACGNEPRGAWVPWVSKFVEYWKKTDSRRVYTGASVGQGWAWQPQSEYHVKAGARGLSWSNAAPETMSDYRSRIDTIKQPYISHETGQWCVFPNFDEIKKYTGVCKARNFELFEEDLSDNDMAGKGHTFMMASGNLQVLCYKHEIEKTLRTPGYAGFQLLSLNDYSGQGTALVGVLDAFWDEKGYANAAQFSHFCNSTVPLVRMPRFVFRNTDSIDAQVEIFHFGKNDFLHADIDWRVTDSNGKVVFEGKFNDRNILQGANTVVGFIRFSLSSIAVASKLNLQVSVNGTYSNDWDFWVYPVQKHVEVPSDVYVCNALDNKAIKQLKNGGKVLVLAAGKIQYGKDVVQYFTPVFWNTSWFKMRPPHTTGVSVNQNHPVFSGFVTDNWANMQWWELVNRAQCMLLTDFPKGFQPIVQPIDTWFVNRKLGLMFEARVGNGKLLMTSMDLLAEAATHPVSDCLYRSVLNYMHSNQFAPQQAVEVDVIQNLFSKVALPINSFTKSSPDELKKDVK